MALLRAQDAAADWPVKAGLEARISRLFAEMAALEACVVRSPGTDSEVGEAKLLIALRLAEHLGPCTDLAPALDMARSALSDLASHSG